VEPRQTLIVVTPSHMRACSLG